MIKMEIGKKNWVFCDGYLPPKGDNPEFEGHEALMLTNLNDKKAKIELVIVFEDREPEGGIFVDLLFCGWYNYLIKHKFGV